MDAALGEYRLDQYRCYRFHAFTEFDQNRKVMMDGLIDGYHVHFVHGATIRPYFYMNMMARVPLEGEHLIWGKPRRSIQSSAASRFGGFYGPEIGVKAAIFLKAIFRVERPRQHP